MAYKSEAQKRADERCRSKRERLTIAAHCDTEPQLYAIIKELKRRECYSAELKRLLLREYGNASK